MFGILKSCISYLLLSWVTDETEAITVWVFHRTWWSCSNKDNGCYLQVDPKDMSYFRMPINTFQMRTEVGVQIIK